MVSCGCGRYDFFGVGPTLVAAASAKGLSLALLVMLIVWAAVFLYNLVNDLGAVQVIAQKIMSSTGDRLLQALLLAGPFRALCRALLGSAYQSQLLRP
jgi:lactate permease